nr:hypothetical protein [Tanacetum cinerariifolium]
MNLLNEECLNYVYGDGKPLTCNECGGILRAGSCFPYNLREENSLICDQNVDSFNDNSFNNPNYLPQPQYENYLCNLCGNNSHDGYDCQQQFPSVYEQEPSYNQNYNDNYYSRDLTSFPCCDNYEGSHETFQCQPMAQNIDFSNSDQIQTPQYRDVHLPSQEINKEVFQVEGELMKSIQTFLETFNCIPFEEKPMILLEAWFKFFTIQRAQPEDSNELFQKLLEDLKELAEYKESLENPSNEIATSSSNPKKEEPPQDSDIRLLIREECCVDASEEQKQNLEDTILELVKICQEKEFHCIHDNVDDLIESDLNTKLLLINSQRLDKKEQEVKKVVEQPAERGNRSKNEVTSEDKRECDMLICEDSSTSDVCDNHSDIFSDSKIDDDISSDDDDFEDVEYVEASLFDPEIVNVDLREKLLSVTRLISNIESLNDNPIPNLVLNSSVSIPIFKESGNSLSDNFSPEFKTFCDHTEETRSGNTTYADNSLPEYDSFCFEIEPDQERLINVKSNIFDESSNDPLLEEAGLFLASDNSIPPGIENFADDSEGDIRFLEELLFDDSILSHESSDSNFEDNPSILRPPPKPPDADFEIDFGNGISVVI